MRHRLANHDLSATPQLTAIICCQHYIPKVGMCRFRSGYTVPDFGARGHIEDDSTHYDHREQA